MASLGLVSRLRSCLSLVSVGDYLTLDAMRALAEDAGYLSVDDMQRLAKSDGRWSENEDAT